MSLFEQVKADWIAARKSGDSTAKNLLTVFYSELANLTKSAGHAATIADAEVVALAKKYQSNAEQTLKILAESETSKIAELQREYELVSAYVPKQFSETELTEIIGEIMAKTGVSGPKTLGPIMAELKACYSGQYDSKMASEIIKQLVNS